MTRDMVSSDDIPINRVKHLGLHDLEMSMAVGDEK